MVENHRTKKHQEQLVLFAKEVLQIKNWNWT